MNVVVAGPGLMGAQIGVEYALGGHAVFFLARDQEKARGRIDAAFQLAAAVDLYPVATIRSARDRVGIVGQVADVNRDTDVVVESISEQLDEKIELLDMLAQRLPAAILASNTSSLSITALGEGAGAPERMIGTHYWNPPLLMPLVEVVSTERTDPAFVTTITGVLTALGKRPVVARRDVPGFIWNRMQLALLREAVWLAENGVASPEAIDQVVREGLARRWRYTGPFQTAALGGAAIFERIASNLWPVLSNAGHLDDLRRWLNEDPARLRQDRERRDSGLRDDLRRDQVGAASEREKP